MAGTMGNLTGYLRDQAQQQTRLTMKKSARLHFLKSMIKPANQTVIHLSSELAAKNSILFLLISELFYISLTQIFCITDQLLLFKL